MKKALLLTLLLALANANLFATGRIFMVVWTADGGQNVYTLLKQPVVTFGNEGVTITYDNATATYATADIKKITYENDNPTSIEFGTTTDKAFSYDGECLTIPATKTTTVSIHTADGKTVTSKRIGKGEHFQLSLSTLDEGIYIVCINNLSYKLIKK